MRFWKRKKVMFVNPERICSNECGKEYAVKKQKKCSHPLNGMVAVDRHQTTLWCTRCGTLGERDWQDKVVWRSPEMTRNAILHPNGRFPSRISLPDFRAVTPKAWRTILNAPLSPAAKKLLKLIRSEWNKDRVLLAKDAREIIRDWKQLPSINKSLRLHGLPYAINKEGYNVTLEIISH